jgi:hypothetical protein
VKLLDLPIVKDVKGGSVHTNHTDKPEREPSSNWVALRDYFTLWLERLEVFYTRRFEDLDAKTTLALAAADKAVTKAEIATEKRFEGVNEFRGSLADSNARMMPREEASSKFENMEKDLAAIVTSVSVLSNRVTSVESRSTILAIFFTIFQIILLIVSYFIFHK